MGAGELTRGRGAGYESYYGLSEPPFSLTPGVRFTYRSRAYSTAIEEVERGVARREGLIVITGEIGTGKTMLCRALMQDSDPLVFASLVTDPSLSAEALLEHVLWDFGVLPRRERADEKSFERHQLLLILRRFLASLLPLGARALIIIDEAQHLHPAVLEQIRLWADFEVNDSRLLQIVLAGQSELDDLLRRPDMRQVMQRVSRRCELTRLLDDEVPDYLEHRLRVARADTASSPPAGLLRETEASRVRFTATGARTVAALSQGVPRLVNLLADRALEVGHERHARDLDASIVRAAAQRLNLVPETSPQFAWRAATAAAAVAIIVLLPFAWAGVGRQAVRPSAPPASSATASVTSMAGSVRPAAAPQDMMDVTIVSFRSPERADAAAARLVQQGVPAFTRRGPGGVWHQLIVGPFVSSEEAARAHRALEADGMTGTDVHLESMATSETAELVGGRGTSGAAAPLPASSMPRRQRALAAPAAAVTPAAMPAPAVAPAETYHAAIVPAIERFEQLAPFLLSASKDPSAPVLKALGGTLADLRQEVGAVPVPQESQRTHGLLSSAIAVATTAVDPSFSGDRAAQARQALTLLDQVKAGL